MKNIILIWLSMITFMFLGISFVEWEINPSHWEDGKRIVFFLLSIFSFAFSLVANELFVIGKKKND